MNVNFVENWVFFEIVISFKIVFFYRNFCYVPATFNKKLCDVSMVTYICDIGYFKCKMLKVTYQMELHCFSV